MTRFATYLVVMALSLACNRASNAAPTEPAQGGPPPPLLAAKRYQAALQGPNAAKVKTETELRIEIKPAKGLHLNQEFPVSLELTGTQVKPAKDKLAKADAQTFKEDGAVFVFKATPQAAGACELKVALRFAVCTDHDCFPVKDTLTWKTVAAK
jgi:hypothetical protein